MPSPLSRRYAKSDARGRGAGSMVGAGRTSLASHSALAARSPLTGRSTAAALLRTPPAAKTKARARNGGSSSRGRARQRARPQADSHEDRVVYLSQVTGARTTGPLAAGKTGRNFSAATVLDAAVQWDREYSDDDADSDDELRVGHVHLNFTQDVVAVCEALFDDDMSSDVTLRAPSGRTYRAHRAILSGWSRVFRELLSSYSSTVGEHGAHNSCNEVVDLPFEGEPAALECLLRSFYCGRMEIETHTAAPLLAVCAAYDVALPAAACKRFLEANIAREQWSNELRQELRAMRGVGRMDEMWRRAEQLVSRLPQTPVDRATQLCIRSPGLRVNMTGELTRVVSSLFDLRGSHGHFADATLVSGDREFFVHRGILSGWSEVLREKFLQPRQHDSGASARGHAVRANRGCRVNLAFLFDFEHSQQDQEQATADAIADLLRVFYTGKLELFDQHCAQSMLQTAVAFKVPTVELACRTWLMSMVENFGHHSLPLPQAAQAAPAQAGHLTDTGCSGYGTKKPWKKPVGPANIAAQAAPSQADLFDHPLDDIYRRLDHSGYGLSLQEVDEAMISLAPDLCGRHNGGTIDRNVTISGAGAHGIELEQVNGPPFPIKCVRTGGLVAEVRPPLLPGMELLTINRRDVTAGVGFEEVNTTLQQAFVDSEPVTLTVRSSKPGVADRAKVLHWAYKAADIGGDGWISRRQFRRMGKYLHFVHAKLPQIQHIVDKLGRELDFDQFTGACAIMNESGASQDFETLKQLSFQSGTHHSPLGILVQFDQGLVDTTFVERAEWRDGSSSHSTSVEILGQDYTAKGSRVSGLRPGDVVISVDGIAVANESHADVVQQISHGKQCTTVGLCSSVAARAQTVSTDRFIEWVIRKSVGHHEEPVRTTHLVKFNKSGPLPIALASIRDEQRGINKPVIKWVAQDSEAAHKPGLRSGMVLTSIRSPIFRRYKSMPERLFDWVLGDSASINRMSKGARRRIKARKEAERERLLQAWRSAASSDDGSGHIDWDTLCLMGVEAVTKLLEQSFGNSSALPIFLGFGDDGKQNLWYPGIQKCDEAFAGAAKKKGFISLSGIDKAVHSLFGRDSELSQKAILRAFHAADKHGDGCVNSRSFRRLVQFLVYYHNNSAVLDTVEAQVVTQGQVLTLDSFHNCSEIMGERLTDEEAITEFSQLGAERVSFDHFCTWIARRAAVRMDMDSAFPSSVHVVSHADAHARSDRLLMPPKAQVESIFQQHCSTPGSMSYIEAVAAVPHVFAEAPQRRLKLLTDCAVSALKKDLKSEDRSLDYSPCVERRDFNKLLRYSIMLDDVWDRVCQLVHHKMAPRRGAATGCCATPPARWGGDLDNVLFHSDFLNACRVSGHMMTASRAQQEFDKLATRGQVRLKDFCEWVIRCPNSDIDAGSVTGRQPTSAEIEKCFTDYCETEGVTQLSIKQVEDAVSHDPLRITINPIVMQAAVKSTLRQRTQLGHRDFHAFVEIVAVLSKAWQAIVAEFSIAMERIYLGDFRRCCYAAGIDIADAEMAHEFRQLESLLGKLDTGVVSDGYVTIAEFLVWVAHRHTASNWMAEPPPTRINSIFNRYADTSGLLSTSEIRQGVKELFPGFDNDELLTMAFKATLDSRVQSIQGLIDRDQFDHLLKVTRFLAAHWASLQQFKPVVSQKDFHLACRSIGRKPSAGEAARQFLHLDSSKQRKISLEDFCIWAARSANLSTNSPATYGVENAMAYFERHAHHGLLPLNRAGEALDLCGTPSSHISSHIAVLVYKAAGIQGISQLTRNQFSDLVQCAKDAEEAEPHLHKLYASVFAEDGEPWNLGAAASIDAALAFFANPSQRKEVEYFQPKHTSSRKQNKGIHVDDSLVALQFMEGGEKRIAFGDLCCWLLKQMNPSRQRHQLNVAGEATDSLDNLLDTMQPRLLYKLGLQYQTGDRIAQSSTCAARCFRVAADRGFQDAQRAFGECLSTGDGVPADTDEAALYYERAAAQGDVVAKSHLGVCYMTGVGVEQDFEAATQLFMEAGDDPIAQFNLGMCYSNGHGVNQNDAEAVQYYELAADQGVPEAHCNLGECLMNGTGIGADLTKAVEHYMLAAKQGLAAAMFNLGRCYSNGLGVALDTVEGLRYYKRAADLKHAGAVAQLAKLEERTHQEHAEAQYQHGQALLTEWRSSHDSRILIESMQCFLHAVGLHHCGAQYEMSLMALTGTGMLSDEGESLRYAKMAAKAQHMDAAHLCGCILLSRWSNAAEQSHHVFDEAVYYLTLAAEGGQHQAQFNLGQIYIAQGYDKHNELLQFATHVLRVVIDAVSADLDTSVEEPMNLEGIPEFIDGMMVADSDALATAAQWLAKAAEWGYIQAMLVLGNLYLRGHGVHQSDTEAAGWFRLAADHGNAQGQCASGWLILKGTGATQHFGDAERMFRLSSQQHHAEASAVLAQFDQLEACCRESNGNFAVLLALLESRHPELYYRAKYYMSAQILAQISNERLKHYVPTSLEEDIQSHVLEHCTLSSEAADLSQKIGALDLHMQTASSDSLPDSIVLVSSRHASLGQLLDSVKPAAAAIVCDESDTLATILARVHSICAEGPVRRIALMLPAQGGGLQIVRGTPISLDTIDSGNVMSFWEGLSTCVQDGIDVICCTPGKPAMMPDAELQTRLKTIAGTTVQFYDTLSRLDATKYFTGQLAQWRRAAVEHEAARRQHVDEAEGTASRIENDARQVEERHRRGQHARSEELNSRRKGRQERLVSIGAPKTVQMQLDAVSRDAQLHCELVQAPHILFKCALDQCKRRMSTTPGLTRLPWIIELCARQLHRRLDDKIPCADLFRIPENMDTFQDLRTKFDAGGDNLELEDLHDINTLDMGFIIVKWLSDLPQPLLSTHSSQETRSMYNNFQEVGAVESDGSPCEGRAIQRLRDLVQQLPLDNRSVLEYIVRLLRKVAQCKDFTKMDESRISLSVSPALLRDPLQPSNNAPRLNFSVVTLMIKHFPGIFGKPNAMPGHYTLSGQTMSGRNPEPVRGTLLLTHDKRVEGFFVTPFTSSIDDSARVASSIIRHVESGEWQWDGSVEFRAR
jgi:TPR repeat protein/Ca2+-binding EF-hand superfamily protein